MDIFLSKLLPQLIYPLALCLWLAILSGLLVFWRKKVAVALLFFSMGILWISSMPAFSSYLIASLERRSGKTRSQRADVEISHRLTQTHTDFLLCGLRRIKNGHRFARKSQKDGKMIRRFRRFKNERPKDL